MGLADNKCVPCRGGVPPLPKDRIQALLNEVGRGWALNPQGHLERLYTFKDFAQALGFVNKVGAVAEAEAGRRSHSRGDTQSSGQEFLRTGAVGGGDTNAAHG